MNQDTAAGLFLSELHSFTNPSCEDTHNYPNNVNQLIIGVFIVMKPFIVPSLHRDPTTH